MLKALFEHHYQAKLIEISFEEGSTLEREQDIMEWRQQWLSALGSWHSPYKAVIDFSNVCISGELNESDIKDAFNRMSKLLSGFFLKKAVIFAVEERWVAVFPFEVVETKELAFEKINIRAPQKKTAGDFRSAISLENHFQQHVVELSFEYDVVLDSVDKLDQLKSKITNNLMQWHSAWSLLIDCSKLEVVGLEEEFEKMIKFFRGFFLKEVFGYGPRSKDQSYPFKVFRSRHNAAGRLESEGHFSGGEADCQSRKTKT